MKAAMNAMHRLFPIGHFVISLLFLAAGFALVGIAGTQLWQGVQLFEEMGITDRLNFVLESIAVLTVAVAALELGQTILEEEVQRAAHMSAPTRVRRFLSRFMIVLVVAMSIESVVLMFRVSQESPEQLPYVASVGLAAAALLAAWGLFVWLNRTAEELEPEAMAAAKREDQKVQKSVKGDTRE
jgi:hypothetical protein